MCPQKTVTATNYEQVATSVFCNVLTNKGSISRQTLRGRSILALDYDELIDLGLTKCAALKFLSFTRKIIEMNVPPGIPKAIHSNGIQCTETPPFWREVYVQGKKVYFNTQIFRFQLMMPEVTAEDLKSYNTDDLIKFVKCIEVIHRGGNILSVIRNQGITGKDLLSMHYRDLIRLCVNEKEANGLMLKLLTLQGTVPFIEFDKDDTWIWAHTLGVSQKALEFIRTCDITGKKLINPKDLMDFLKISGFSEEDALKIAEAVKPFRPDKPQNAVLSANCSTNASDAKLSGPGLDTLTIKFQEDHYKTLAEALEKAKIKNKRDILKNAKKWKWNVDTLTKYGLTKEEAAAIFVYSYDFGKDDFEDNPYRVLNKTLTKYNKNDPSTKINNFYYYILHLLSALRKLPRKETGVLYRGIKLDEPFSGKVGSMSLWPAFTSTTEKEDTALGFVEGGKVRVLFEIHGNFVGYDISPFSSLGGECEILLEPETKFCIENVTQDTRYPGVTHVTVKVIKTPLVLAESVMLFNEAKVKQEKSDGKSAARWEFEDAVLIAKPSVLLKMDTPPYCPFKEAFKKAGFDCTYEDLENVRKRLKAPINIENRLSDEEAFTIFTYTVDEGGKRMPYRVVNKALAERSSGSVAVYPYILHLLHAIRNLPQYKKDELLYRGIDGKFLNKDNYKKGNILTWPAFTSVTYNREKAYEFVMENWIEHKVVFEIQGDVTGYEISDYSMFPDECEVLLEPETKFKIKEITNDPMNSNIQIICVKVYKTKPIIPDIVNKLFEGKDKKILIQQQPHLPPNWVECVDQSSGLKYYANTVTKATQWEFPNAQQIMYQQQLQQQQQLYQQLSQSGGAQCYQKHQQCQNYQPQQKQQQQQLYLQLFQSEGAQCYQKQKPQQYQPQQQQQQQQQQQLSQSGGAQCYQKQKSQQYQQQQQQQQQQHTNLSTSQNAILTSSQQPKQQSHTNNHLPPDWAECFDQSGRKYYKNLITGKVQSNFPQQLLPNWAFPQLPPNWAECTDPKTGRKYYANSVTKVTQWYFPTN